MTVRLAWPDRTGPTAAARIECQDRAHTPHASVEQELFDREYAMKRSWLAIRTGRLSARLGILVTWTMVVLGIIVVASLNHPLGWPRYGYSPWGSMWADVAPIVGAKFIQMIALVWFGLLSHAALAGLLCYIEKNDRQDGF